MENFKGTKGKWLMDCTKSAIESSPNYLPIISEDGRTIALVNHTSGIIHVREYAANAEIIRAAPQLAEQLHTLAMMTLQSDFYHDYPDFKREVDNSLALIKSATELNP